MHKILRWSAALTASVAVAVSILLSVTFIAAQPGCDASDRERTFAELAKFCALESNAHAAMCLAFGDMTVIPDQTHVDMTRVDLTHLDLSVVDFRIPPDLSVVDFRRNPDLAPPPDLSQLTPAFLQISPTVVGSGTTTPHNAITVAGGVGHILVAIAHNDNGHASLSTPTDTQGNTWLPGPFDSTALNGQAHWLWWTFPASSGALTVTYPNSQQFDTIQARVLELTGISSINTVDQQLANDTGSGSVINGGPITTACSQDIIIASSSQVTGGLTTSVPVGFTQITTWGSLSSSIVYRVVGPGTYTSTWLLSGAGNKEKALTIAFRGLGCTNGAAPPDMSPPPDLSHPDLTVIRDLTGVAQDLTRLPDMTAPPDLVPTADAYQEPVAGASQPRIMLPPNQTEMHFVSGLPFRIVANGFEGSSNGHLNSVTFLMDGSTLGTVNSDPANPFYFECSSRNQGGTTGVSCPSLSTLAAGDHILTVTGISPTLGFRTGVEPVVIHVDALPTHSGVMTLSADTVVTGGTSLSITDTNIDCAGFKFTANGGSTTGNITFKNNHFQRCGAYGTHGIDLYTTNGFIDFEGNTYEAGGPIYLKADGSGAVTFSGNEIRASTFVNYSTIDPYADPMVVFKGTTTGVKLFQSNRIGSGITLCQNMTGAPGWKYGGTDTSLSNVSIGLRSVFNFDGCSNVTGQGNYIADRYYGGWSQGHNLELLSGSSGFLWEHNVHRGGSWPWQSISGEFRYNLVVEGGHDSIRDPKANAYIHHNVFASPSDSGSDGVVYAYTGLTGMAFVNNTVDGLNQGSAGRGQPVLGIEACTVGVGTCFGTGATTFSRMESNLVRNMIAVGATPFGGASLIGFGGHGGGTLGSQRVSSAGYNLTFNSPSARLYAVGIVTTALGHDVTADPQLGRQYPAAYPVDDRGVWNGSTSEADVLSFFRTMYQPASTSPAVGGGNPADVGGNFNGAIGPVGTSISTDKFGLGLSSARVLLNSTNLTAVRAQAAAPTAMWTTFINGLTARFMELPSGFPGGDYQGAYLQPIADFALCYQALKVIDPVTAAKCADKTLALVASATNDPIPTGTGGTAARQFFGRGDASTTDFPMGHSDFVGSTVSVYVPTVAVAAVTSHTTNGQENGPSNQVYFVERICNAASGTACSNATGPATTDYVKGVDWNRDCTRTTDGFSTVNWAPPLSGHQPSSGATYYLNEVAVDAMGTKKVLGTDYTIVGSNIHFLSGHIPAANQLVFAEFIWGTSSTDGSTLNYQMTSMNEAGGLCSQRPDTGFASRYLGKFTALGLDWIDGYAGLTPALRASTMSMLVKWFDYTKTNIYRATDMTSNYGLNVYGSNMMTALALQKRDPTNGARLVTEITATRTTGMVPALTGTGPALSNHKGFWVEGWQYGQQAGGNILLAGLAYNNAGLGTIAEEQAWAGDAIEELISSQTDVSSIVSNGYYGATSGGIAPLPGKGFFILPTAVTTSSTDKAYGNYILQGGGIYSPAISGAGWQDLLYRDVAASTTNPIGALPLTDYVDGDGLLLMRAAWDGFTGMVVTQETSNLSNETTDHREFQPGNITIQRGPDDLLPNTPMWNKLNDGNRDEQSWYANAVNLQGRHCGGSFPAPDCQTYAFGSAFYYGKGAGLPGVRFTAVDVQPTFVYSASDYAAAYNLSTRAQGMVNYLTRDMLYYRPGNYVLEFERIGAKDASTLKSLRHHTLAVPTMLGGNGWSVVRGASKLFGQSYSDHAISTTTTTVSPSAGGPTISQINTVDDNTSATLNIWTALQAAPSGQSAIDTIAPVTDAFGFMQGLRIGGLLAMDTASSTPLPLGQSVAYTLPAGSFVNVLMNVQPSTSYTVVGAVPTTASSDSKGVLTFASAVAGTIVVTDSAHAFNLSTSGRTLLNKGAPFPIYGDAGWEVAHNLTPTQQQTYFTDRLSRGFNSTFVEIIEHKFTASKPPKDLAGNLPFNSILGTATGSSTGAAYTGSPNGTTGAGTSGLTGNSTPVTQATAGSTYAADPYSNSAQQSPDFTCPNAAYWAAMDAYYQLAQANKQVVFTCPMYLGFNTTDEGWTLEEVANHNVVGAGCQFGQPWADNTKTKAWNYGAWLAAHYKNYGNIVWILGGDKGVTASLTAGEIAAITDIYNGMQSVSGQLSTQVTAHWDRTNYATSNATFAADVTFQSIYADLAAAQRARTAYAAAALPIFEIENYYVNNGAIGANPDRLYLWESWMGAPGGGFMGDELQWPMTTNFASQFSSVADMARVAAFFNLIAWQTLVPSGLNSMAVLVTAGGGTAVPQSADYIAAAASADGKLMVAYYPPAGALSRSVTFNMATLTNAGTATAQWFDPVSGLYTSAGSGIATSGTHAFVSPAVNNAGGKTDYVLKVTAP